MIGDKIRDLRKKIGLTQEQLAGDELTKSYVSQVELGRIRPSRKALEIIARRLSKPLGYFLENEDDLRTVDVLLKASDALLMSQRLDEAMVGLQEAQHLAERIGRDDILAQIQLTMGRVEQSRRDYVEAIKHFRAALERLSPEDNPSQVISASTALGRAAEEAGLFHEAVAYFHRSVEVARLGADPRLRAAALTKFGDFCFRDHKWASALALYEEAYQAVGDSADKDAGLAVRIAAARCRLGQWDDAQASADQAVNALAQMASGESRAWLAADLACCLVQLHDFHGALDLVRESVASAQNFPSALAHALQSALAVARHSSDPLVAQHYIAQSLEQPERAEFVPIKAEAYALAADLALDSHQASEYLAQALSQEPDNQRLRLKLAAAKVRAGRTEAVDDLLKMVQEQPARTLPLPSFSAQ